MPARWLNLRSAPTIHSLREKKGAPPDVNQLTWTKLTNFVPHKVYRGPASIEFTKSPADHYADFPVLEVVEGFYYSSDFTLNDGEIIHDFLK